MRMSSYSDALCLINDAIDSYNRFKRNGRINDLKHALSNLLRSYILLSSGHYLPDLDITNLASIALDEGLINGELYAEIVSSNLVLNGYLTGSLSVVEETFNTVLKELSKYDPYINQQMLLFRY
ncbi:MAG: hypothetical protein QXX81_02945 [Zestosphaera sp.]